GGGGARPNLLLAMCNGVGGETMLRYEVASRTPESRLPFPHWIVAERELRDSVFDQAPLRTSFAYRGGLFDAVDRELRGFAMVQQVDSVGTVRVREYHQDRRRAGRLRRITNLAPSPCVATDPQDPEDPLDPCSPWRFPLGM
ncbi:MAG: toxin TcdB middle/N-terminal domain-containing protein, partial [Candidatus Binatia bacterium]